MCLFVSTFSHKTSFEILFKLLLQLAIFTDLENH